MLFCLCWTMQTTLPQEKGLAAILRQERKSLGELIAEVARALKKSRVEDVNGKKLVSLEEEVMDVNQMSAIR